MADLILTNGDSAVDILAEAGVAGRIMPWRDILHEGPLVPARRMEDLSNLRAGYLARRYGLDEIVVRSDFAARDAVMRGHADYDRITIWLEHDLYDQLQLLQMLTFFAAEGRTDGVVLVQADDFLGSQTPATILRFAAHGRGVDPVMLDLAAKIWGDLTEMSPQSVARRAAGAGAMVTHLMPFVLPALNRFLAELPAPESGLTRTETTVLQLLDRGACSVSDLFKRVLTAEEAPFMGDWSFFALLDDLALCQWPLIEGIAERFRASGDAAAYARQRLSLTEFGETVLSGNVDHIVVNGIERNWAGTRLTATNCWRFDRDAGRLVAPRTRNDVTPRA